MSSAGVARQVEGLRKLRTIRPLLPCLCISFKFSSMLHWWYSFHTRSKKPSQCLRLTTFISAHDYASGCKSSIKLTCVIQAAKQGTRRTSGQIESGEKVGGTLKLPDISMKLKHGAKKQVEGEVTDTLGKIEVSLNSRGKTKQSWELVNYCRWAWYRYLPRNPVVWNMLNHIKYSFFIEFGYKWGEVRDIYVDANLWTCFVDLDGDLQYPKLLVGAIAQGFVSFGNRENTLCFLPCRHSLMNYDEVV